MSSINAIAKTSPARHELCLQEGLELQLFVHCEPGNLLFDVLHTHWREISSIRPRYKCPFVQLPRYVLYAHGVTNSGT